MSLWLTYNFLPAEWSSSGGRIVAAGRPPAEPSRHRIGAPADRTSFEGGPEWTLPPSPPSQMTIVSTLSTVPSGRQWLACLPFDAISENSLGSTSCRARKRRVEKLALGHKHDLVVTTPNHTMMVNCSHYHVFLNSPTLLRLLPVLSNLRHEYSKTCLKRHPTVQEKVVVIDRWSLKQGSLNSGRFLLNGGKRRGTHAYDQRNDKSRRPGASGGLVWWFSRKLALGWLF